MCVLILELLLPITALDFQMLNYNNTIIVIVSKWKNWTSDSELLESKAHAFNLYNIVSLKGKAIINELEQVIEILQIVRF